MAAKKRKRGMSFLVHGHSKVGKTTLALTAPYPRLLLDVEAAAHLLPNFTIWWDPMTEAMPVADGTWDTCVVDIDNFAIALKVYELIKGGNHPFRSLIIDSISELQAKVIEAVNNRGQMRQQDWGMMLSKLSFFCRDLRDLARKKDNPIEAVVLTAMTKKFDTNEDGSGGIYKPFLQGQISSLIPYWFDVTAYYFIQNYMDPETKKPIEVRRLLTGKNDQFEAGNRARLEEFINYPNIEQIINSFFGPREEAAMAVMDQHPDPDAVITTIVQKSEETIELSSAPKMTLPTLNK